MPSENSHLSEQDLALAAAGELTPRRRDQAVSHLETCWSCRERMQSIENAIAAFVRARNRELNVQLPPADGPRALLRARMAQAAPAPALSAFWKFGPAAAAFLCVVLAILGFFEVTANAKGPKPMAGITPGETRPISLDEVCRTPNAQVITPDIPEEKRRLVFAAYGIDSPRSSQFEVDYLITPDLGGTESIRNLWPQPYSARWNARVKDRLEQRLHQLVCARKLDLTTAQRDIAVDWIGAYRKYMTEAAPR